MSVNNLQPFQDIIDVIDKECSGDFRDVCIALLKDHLDFDVESVELLLGVMNLKRICVMYIERQKMDSEIPTEKAAPLDLPHRNVDADEREETASNRQGV